MLALKYHDRSQKINSPDGRRVAHTAGAMTTAFQTGPGFYAANSKKSDQSIPAGKLRIYCARIEAYDMDLTDDEEPALDTSFELLVAKSQGNPQIAKALLQLHKSLGGSLEVLKAEAAQ